jgi:DMSO/TMAO reductase YedYZ molybdopterin-dependent catalytic subunit
MTRRLVIAAYTIIMLTGVVFGQTGVLRVGGAVPHPLMLGGDEMARLPHESVTTSAHDQSGRYEGVLLIELLKRAGVPTGEAIRGPQLAKYVLVTGADGYRVVFSLAELDAALTGRTVLLADKRDGAALPDHALPYQLVVPGDTRPTRWVRQVISVEILDAPRTPY